MLKTISSFKKFVKRHKTKIVLFTLFTVTTVAVLEYIGLRQHDDFLKEKGLLEEYYHPED